MKKLSKMNISLILSLVQGFRNLVSSVNRCVNFAKANHIDESVLAIFVLSAIIYCLVRLDKKNNPKFYNNH